MDQVKTIRRIEMFFFLMLFRNGFCGTLRNAGASFITVSLGFVISLALEFLTVENPAFAFELPTHFNATKAVNVPFKLPSLC